MIFKAEKIFSAFFFAIPKTFPIFAVNNIYCQAGDVRQLLAGFFYARIKLIILTL